MAIHIGKKIKDVFTRKGMKTNEFARRLNKSRENIYSIFKRETIDTGLLTEISKVLEHDFFQYFTPLKTEVEELRREVSLLKEMHGIVKKKASVKGKK